MNDDHDPILDACLDEVLGGRTPPDLAARILSRLPMADRGDLLPPACVTAIEVVRSGDRPRSQVTNRLPSRRRNYQVMAAVTGALSLGLLAVLIVAGYLANQPSDEGVARQPGITPPPAAPDLVRIPDATNVPPQIELNQSPSAVVLPDSKLVRQPSSSVPASPLPSFANENKFSVESLVSQTNLPQPLPDADVVALINAAVIRDWEQRQVPPPKRVDADTWTARAFHTLLGRAPNPAELAHLNTARSREEMLATLTTADEYVEEFARRWSEWLTDAFLAPDLLAGNPLAHRDGMLQYFRRALLDRKSWDRIAEDLMTATGSGLPGTANYNGAANFLLARADQHFLQGTADVSRLLAGREVSCAQCHDAVDGATKQREFWELNAFFRQLAVKRGENASAELVNVDFAESSGEANDGAVFFEDPNGLLKMVYPKFQDRADALPKSGSLAVINRREVLAKLLTQSLDFRRTATNRFWSAVLGRGLVPDNERLENAEHEQLLRTLSDQFAAHGFDPRKLLAWTVLSDPFAMPTETSTSLLARAEPPRFDRFYEGVTTAARPVRETLAALTKDSELGAPQVATTAKLSDQPSTKKKEGKVVLEPAGPSSKLLDASAATISPVAQSVLTNTRMNANQKAAHLFQITLHRAPRPSESAMIDKFIATAGDDSRSALVKLWSALQALDDAPSP